jgi:hypothetical protein
MTVGLAAIYLAQVRIHFVIGSVVVLLFAAMLALRARRRAFAAVAMTAFIVAVASLNLALLVGGSDVFDRFELLFDDAPHNVYHANRGQFLAYTYYDLLPEYPLGAGLGRWGMSNLYFGDQTDLRRGLIPGVEIQWTAWLLDGGLPLVLIYVAAVVSAIAVGWGLSRRRDGSDAVALWAMLVVAYDLGALMLTFTYPLFIGEHGLQFWLLNALVFAAATHERERRAAAGP